MFFAYNGVPSLRLIVPGPQDIYPIHRFLVGLVMAAVAFPIRWIAARLIERGYDNGCPDMWLSLKGSAWLLAFKADWHFAPCPTEVPQPRWTVGHGQMGSALRTWVRLRRDPHMFVIAMVERVVVGSLRCFGCCMPTLGGAGHGGGAPEMLPLKQREQQRQRPRLDGSASTRSFRRFESSVSSIRQREIRQHGSTGALQRQSSASGGSGRPPALLRAAWSSAEKGRAAAYLSGGPLEEGGGGGIARSADSSLHIKGAATATALRKYMPSTTRNIREYAAPPLLPPSASRTGGGAAAATDASSCRGHGGAATSRFHASAAASRSPRGAAPPPPRSSSFKTYHTELARTGSLIGAIVAGQTAGGLAGRRPDQILARAMSIGADGSTRGQRAAAFGGDGSRRGEGGSVRGMGGVRTGGAGSPAAMPDVLIQQGSFKLGASLSARADGAADSPAAHELGSRRGMRTASSLTSLGLPVITEARLRSSVAGRRVSAKESLASHLSPAGRAANGRQMVAAADGGPVDSSSQPPQQQPLHALMRSAKNESSGGSAQALGRVSSNLLDVGDLSTGSRLPRATPPQPALLPGNGNESSLVGAGSGSGAARPRPPPLRTHESLMPAGCVQSDLGGPATTPSDSAQKTFRRDLAASGNSRGLQQARSFNVRKLSLGDLSFPAGGGPPGSPDLLARTQSISNNNKNNNNGARGRTLSASSSTFHGGAAGGSGARRSEQLEMHPGRYSAAGMSAGGWLHVQLPGLALKRRHMRHAAKEDNQESDERLAEEFQLNCDETNFQRTVRMVRVVSLRIRARPSPYSWESP